MPPTAPNELRERSGNVKRKRDNRRWDEGPTRPAVIGQKEYVEKYEKSANANKGELPETAFQWRQWPWSLLGDNVTEAIGWLVLLLPGPFMGALIFVATITFEGMKWVWRTLLPVSLTDSIKAAVKSFAETLGNRVLRDKRDAPFLPHMTWLATYIPIIFALALWRHHTCGFEWLAMFAYHFARIGPRFRFFAHLHVLVHREGHDHLGLFRAPYRAFNYWPMQWLVGPFFGQVPNSYGIAHNKIHHRFDNGLDDVHTNLDVDRTKFRSFVVYVPRFLLYWLGISPIVHFVMRKEWRLARKMTAGVLYHSALLAAAFYYDPTFALAYLVYPLFEATIFFAGISYLWHCWVDPKDIYNPYVSSVTVLDGHDNIWNEDYHVVHHDALSVHWSNAIEHYETHKDLYEKYQATIFQDTEEGALLFWLLAGNWDQLAKHFVDLSGKLSHQQKIDLLKERASFTIRYNDHHAK